ncbi:MAG TPA: Bor family protein [Gemmatimonadaceae bacterium]|nr:Bor family protein [Gemmatimonadaceae bacterium]
MRIRRAAAVVAAFALTGCYHAVIQTGRPESTDVISIKWANSFIFGLVPPPIVDTASRCTNGVAKVETQHSFLNGLAAVVTFSLYTPMQIDVTCAARGTASAESVIKVEQGRTIEQALGEALRLSAERNTPMYVQF